MSNLNTLPMFFLGANSPKGFISSFGDSFSPREGWRAYILKGGPGTGKSSVMKKIALKFTDENCHICPCSSDPNSLDGVILHDRRTVILDGTSPHIVEPIFPGVCEEIINLGECWDAKILRENREEIFEISEKCSEYHKKAARYIAAAGKLADDTRLTARKYTNIGKCEKFGTRLASKYSTPCSDIPKTWVRYLSGTTPLGHVFYKKTIQKLADTVIVISDEYGSASSVILEAVEKRLQSDGHEIISCRCPMDTEKREHIILPRERICFVTENRFHPIDTGNKLVHARRFCDMPALREERPRLNYNRRTVGELLNMARDALQEAKNAHDLLEEKYIMSMDYEKLGDITDRLYQKIVSE